METIASELPTNALLSPALESCAAKMDVTNAVPPTFNPEYVALFTASSKSSPFHTDVANVIAAVTPNAVVAIIIPLTASYVKDSIVPALAIFFACA